MLSARSQPFLFAPSGRASGTDRAVFPSMTRLKYAPPGEAGRIPVDRRGVVCHADERAAHPLCAGADRFGALGAGVQRQAQDHRHEKGRENRTTHLPQLNVPVTPPVTAPIPKLLRHRDFGRFPRNLGGGSDVISLTLQFECVPSIPMSNTSVTTGGAPPLSLPARFLGIITAPKETFASVVAHPRWLGMLVLTTVIVAARHRPADDDGSREGGDAPGVRSRAWKRSG